MSNRFLIFIKENEVRILVSLFLVLSSLISFRAGQMSDGRTQEERIAINSVNKLATNPREEKIYALMQNMNDHELEEKVAAMGLSKQQVDDEENQECAFVASKNSQVYHAPDCPNAKKIKPENVVCFKTEQEAIDRKLRKAKDCPADNQPK